MDQIPHTHVPAAPIIRPPIPGAGDGARRRPAMPGLAIPPSPNVRPVDPDAALARPQPVPHLLPPALSIAVPSVGGRNASPSPNPARRIRGPALNLAVPADRSAAAQNPASGSELYSSSDDISRILGASVSGPNGSDTAHEGSADMQREASATLLPDISQLSLEKGRPLDVEDLDDASWKAMAKEGMIVELGTLGEGAGGAVTRSILKGGSTVFALKVRLLVSAKDTTKRVYRENLTATKVITTDPNPDVKRQIMRELQINKECASDHICRYYGTFGDDSTGTISIAMEFCEGGSLDSVYKEVKKLGGRTGEKVLGKVAEGVLRGLTYLQGRRIIHRDIKPSNILLCRNGQVKLCDFGVSGTFGTKGDANTFIGTSYYMAPERITGQSYTITSDVWSLGVTLLEVAQHRFPFPADGTEAQPRAGLIDLLTYIVQQPVPKLKDEPENGVKWSENFKYFIECCMEKSPRRATPWNMLKHPWMLAIADKKVNVAKFLQQVWDWKDDGAASVQSL